MSIFDILLLEDGALLKQLPTDSNYQQTIEIYATRSRLYEKYANAETDTIV